MIKIGVVGCGYWGPKQARNFHEMPEAELAWVCDFRQDRLEHMQRLYPEARVTTSYEEVLASDVDAVVLATPVSTHCNLALLALGAGKHVLVEKPLAASAREARSIARAAERLGLTAMVGHTFVYNPAVEAVKEIIASGELGEIYYVNGARVNLGLFQPDINVLWDLAPHDISILMHILGSVPLTVSAKGGVFVQKDRGIHDMANVSARFPDGVLADIRVSWLDPVKYRLYTVVGSKRMLVYDDIAAVDKVMIFDKRVEVPPYSDTEQEFRASYFSGEGVPYPVEWSEPLRRQCSHFVHCIETGEVPLSSAQVGVKVVQVLEAADRSLHNGGCWEDIEWEMTTVSESLRTSALVEASRSLAS
jgi:predicted dehydrogenase